MVKEFKISIKCKGKLKLNMSSVFLVAFFLKIWFSLLNYNFSYFSKNLGKRGKGGNFNQIKFISVKNLVCPCFGNVSGNSGLKRTLLESEQI